MFAKLPYLFSATPHKNARHINSLDFTYYQPKIDFAQYDYLVFTSKQAVKALAYYKKEEFIHIPAICISAFTKEYFENFGGTVFRVGDGLGSDLKKILLHSFSEKKCLHLRAKKLAGESLGVDECVVYESRCSREILHFKLQEKNASLIFTSPSSVRCFLQNNHFLDSHKVVVIGKTTAEALPNAVHYKIAQESSIESCLNLVNSSHFIV